MASSPATAKSALSRSSTLRLILLGGLTVGVLDTLLAIALYRVSPFTIYQSVAGGVYGRASYQHGWTSAALGCFFHFLIATTAAAAYVIASRYLPQGLKPGYKWVCYGAAEAAPFRKQRH